MIKCMHKINSFHLNLIMLIDNGTCYYIGKMLSSKYMRIMLQMDEKRKKNTRSNQFLLLIVNYHVILSSEISFSHFILLVLLHYILGWMGVFSDVVI